jgi:NAD(P)-dependent dehydrogenase (short-subunit alcohol dehydrogenase family)
MAEPKVAIVTGGGSGIGAAAARALAGAGYRLAIMSPSERGPTLARELGGIGRQGSNLAAADIDALVRQTLDQWGRIDAIVTSMGHAKVPKGASWPLAKIGFDYDNAVSLLDIDDAGWQAGFDAYVLSVIRTARAATPAMLKQGGGSFVNISSIAGIEPQGNFPLSALRAALHGFTKLFADRYARYNIRMNNVLPGFVDNVELTEAARAEIPMQRPGRMAEVGEAVLFLASDRSSYITGQSILLDGGLHRSVH